MNKDDSQSPLDRRVGKDTPFQPASDGYKAPPPTAPPSTPPPIPSGPPSGSPMGSSGSPPSSGPAGSPPTQQQGAYNSSVDHVSKPNNYNAPKLKPRVAAALGAVIVASILLIVFLTQGSIAIQLMRPRVTRNKFPLKARKFRNPLIYTHLHKI